MTKFPRAPSRNGFTLVELLVASTIIVILCGMLIQVTGMTAKIWKNTQAKIEQFQAARTAFDSMTRKLSQASLNTYWDYDNPSVLTQPTARPSKYVRQSELRFICGNMSSNEPSPLMTASTRKWVTKGIFFNAPLGYVSSADYRGLDTLYNTWGYFVEFGDDRETRPPIVTEAIVPARYRFRLMEMMAPSENLFIYSQTSGPSRNRGYGSNTWYSNYVSPATGSRPVHVLAENVVALLFVPKLAKKEQEARSLAGKSVLCQNYLYDSYYNPSKPEGDPEINSANQLPPIVEVTMVAIDEASAQKLADKNGAALPVFGASLFRDTTKLHDDPGTTAPTDGDLAKFGKELTASGLNYRVFSANISIRAARWSREQK